jgi:hypothetical protein
MEFFLIEQLERELTVLYAQLDIASEAEKQTIQQHIQERNLRLFRLLPNE